MAGECITLTLEEAVSFTGIGRKNLETLQRNDRRFPSFRIGAKTLVDKHLLVEYIHILAKERTGEVLVNPAVQRVLELRQKKKPLARQRQQLKSE